MEELPKAAQQQGYKNAFFTSLIVLPIMALIWFIITFGFGQSGENGFYFTLLTCANLALAYYLYIRFNNEKNAGAVLLDIMPFPNRNISFLGVGVGLISILFGIAKYLFDETGKISALFYICFGLFVAVFQATMGLSHIQIREKGLWIYGNLLTWNKIEALSWVDDGKEIISLKLLIQGKIPSFLRNGVLPIPANKKDQVSTLINKHFTNAIAYQDRA